MSKAAVSDLVNAELRGRFTYSSFRKTPTQVTSTGLWFDMSMSPGNPVPQYYAASPLVSVQMKYSDQGGLNAGLSVSPFQKHLRNLTVMSTSATPLPMPMILMDYLLFYPFIDEGTTDSQPLTNSVALPRYTDGAGVQVMAITVAGRTGGQTFRFTYTNQDGVSGRVSQTVGQNTSSAIGTIVTSATASNGFAGPFVPLQFGDTGVRSIESVQMVSGTDVGLFTLVLVKPLLQTQIRGIDAPVETDPFLVKNISPIIMDDAYLNFICLPQSSLSAVSIHGDISTVWI